MAGGGSAGGGGSGKGGGASNIYNQAAGASNAGFAAGNRLLGELNKGPGGVTSQGYDAARQAMPGTIASGMSTYANPWTQQVVNNTGRDIQRQTQVGVRDLGAAAAGQHAFGGSRLGVAEGAAVGEGARALGDITSQLRSQGFNTAAGLAGNDISNRLGVAGANQAATNAARSFNATGVNAARQFNVGQRNSWLGNLSGAATQAQNMGQAGVQLGQQIQGATGADAATAQGIAQSLLGQSAGMFDSYTSSPFAGIERVLGALSGNPLSRTGTQTGTQTPGLKSQLATAAGIAAKIPMGGMPV